MTRNNDHDRRGILPRLSLKNKKEMKKFTKKHIQQVLRTLDRTKIFQLYAQMTGTTKCKRGDVYDFIKEYAPTRKISKMAYKLTMSAKQRNTQTSSASYDFMCANERQLAVAKLREESRRPLDGYSKFPILGQTHLYFASPVYELKDYNRSIMMNIAGNERFCDLLINVGKRIYSAKCKEVKI